MAPQLVALPSWLSSPQKLHQAGAPDSESTFRTAQLVLATSQEGPNTRQLLNTYSNRWTCNEGLMAPLSWYLGSLMNGRLGGMLEDLTLEEAWDAKDVLHSLPSPFCKPTLAKTRKLALNPSVLELEPPRLPPNPTANIR